MKVTDLNGCELTVRNLNEAIVIAAENREYRQEDLTFSDFDQRESIYWADLYRKLMAIRYRQESGNPKQKQVIKNR